MDSVPLLLEENTRKHSRLGSFLRLVNQCSSFGEKLAILLGIVFSMCSGVLSPFMSFVFGELTEVIVNATAAITNTSLSPSELEEDLIKFQNDMNNVILHFILVGISYFIAASIQASTFRYVGERITYRIRQKYVYKLLRKDAKYFDKTSTGHLSTILNDNLERLRESLNDKISLIIQLCTDFTVGFAIAFMLDWKLSAYSFLFAMGIAFSGIFNSFSIMNSTEKQNTHYANAGSIAFQALGAFKTVVSLNGQTQELERYEEELKTGEKHGVRRAFYYGLSRAVQYFFVYTLNFLCMYLGANYVYAKTISITILVQVFHNLLFGGFSLSEAFPMFSIVAGGISAATPIADLLNSNDDEIEKDYEETDEDRNFDGRIRFNNVRFSYPTRPDSEVLKGITFEVEKGECIALVGASGSGKSTIVQLLLHYYDITSGEILIDNESIQNINLKSLRKTIGVVSQEPVLFNTTIEENIKFGHPSATSAQIYAALRKANAYDFVCGFPKGIKTVVGERGTQLSGGQKQRIAIARTLLRNPKILLLDEATSALDNESEHIVQKALENASHGRTTIIVAHRLSTIRNANKIIVMQKGEIVEVGNHEELLQLNGIYSDLIQAQVMGDHDEEDNNVTLVSRQTSADSTQTRQYAHQRSSNSETEQEQENQMERLMEELAEEGAVKANLWQILGHCRSDCCVMFMAFLSSALQGLNYPILAQIIANVYVAFAMTGEDILTYGHFWASMFMVLAVTRGLTIFGQYYYFGKLSERLSTRLRVSSFEHLLALPCAFYDDPKHSPTKLSTRLNADASNVKAAVDNRLGNLIMTLVAFVVALILSMMYSWKMTLQVLALCPFLYLGGYAYETSVESSVREETSAFENCNKTAVEAIEHVRTVRALTMENKVMSLVTAHLEKVHRTCLKRSLIQGISYGFSYSAFFFVYAISFKFGVWLVLQREILPADVYRVLMCLAMTSNTAGSAIAYFPDYKKAVYAAGLIFKLFTYPATMHVESKDGRTCINDGHISGEDLHFHYEQRPDHMILKGINLQIDPGKTLALVGPSGCGKSTIISILERFYHLVEGEMRVDKINVEDINLHHLRYNLTLVSQEPTLFNCSIRENLLYGLTRTVPQIEVETALQTANAFQFVYAFPQGLDTIVGERGAQLSGGQKQRIAIARAVLRNPKVLLLDEATSALDTDSEKIVQNALDTASARLTTVVVAHRLSTIINADSIAVLKDGKVVEQGTHEELLRKRNVYYRLVHKQGKNVLE